ncbi:MAG: DUF4097 domain-containing protein [Phycisphaerales bacterium]
MNRISSLVSIAALSAMTTLSGCDSYGGKRLYDYRVMKVPHQQGTALDLVTANGSIKAYKETRQDVAIEVELYGENAERLDFATVHTNRMGDGSLRVWVEWPGGKRQDNEGAKLEIYTPDANGITAKTSNGAVHISGLQGEARVETTNGSIHIEDHQGPMGMYTSNGAIRVEQSDGDVNFRTSNGRIIISDATSLVEGDTSNGSVYVSTHKDASGPVRIRTTNGRVELDLGHGFEGVLRVSTSNGRIKTENLSNANLVQSSNSALELQIGSSEEISAVRTSNGSVRVRGRSDD